LTASAGHGRAERLSVFLERLSEFFEVVCPLLGLLFFFLASAH
jgi:hypothetical protein